MSSERTGLNSLEPTLVRVVLLMRVLGWVWLMVLGVVNLVTRDDLNTGLVAASLVVATAGTMVTVAAGRRGFLANPAYVTGDGVITVLLTLVGPAAGAGDFIAGGYPASWLFIVAFASSMKVAAIVGAAAGVFFAGLHVMMNLGATRAYGSIQFLVIAVVVGWGFDALRRQESLRVAAETEREAARVELGEEQARAARLEERSQIAVRLHDSVLQTLELIRSSADDPGEVRYLARSQVRDLRRTISDYESPHLHSFRSRLLDVQREIEDMYRVEVDQVIKDDAEMDASLETVVAVARDVMTMAARADGARRMDLFVEIATNAAEISVRTFPTQGITEAMSEHVRKQLDDAGGTYRVREAPGNTREVVARVRR